MTQTETRGSTASTVPPGPTSLRWGEPPDNGPRPRPLPSRRRVDILGCPFDSIDIDEAEQFIREAICRNRQAHVTVGNVDMVMLARRDPRFSSVFWESELTVVDGVPILWAATLLDRPLKARVAGVELVERCAAISHDVGCSIAVVGARLEIVQRAVENMLRRFPRARFNVVPTPFPLGAADSRAIVERIRANGDSMVLVALGAPRQEFWIKIHMPATGANVAIGVGGAFDIISGSKPRAASWMRNNGLEWLHRLALEPRRLGYRYLIEDMPFVALVLRERMRLARGGEVR
jgi:N-acetylglucosaminyldiphosphoundecaprenol N-acetyl-beta-D-mannosaminyltransferase